MKKWSLFWKIMMGIMIVGVVMILVGVALGGRTHLTKAEMNTLFSGLDWLDIDIDRDDSILMDVNAREEFIGVRELSVEIKEIKASVEITDDANLYYEATSGVKGSSQMDDDGELELVFDGNKISDDLEVVIYIPEEVFLESLELKVGAGVMNVKEINVGEFSADVAAGTLDVGGSFSGEVDLDVGAGVIYFQDDSNPDDYQYNISNGMGIININEEEFAGFGQFSWNKDGLREMEINCGVGQVEVVVDDNQNK